MSDTELPDPPATDPAPGLAPPTATPPTETRPARRTRRWIVIAAAVVVVVAVGAVTAGVLIADAASVHDGPGTATITWTPMSRSITSASATPPLQPFSGTIGGVSVSGISAVVLPTAATFSQIGNPGTHTFSPFHYRGTLAGKPFALEVTYTYAVPPSTTVSTAVAPNSLPTATVHLAVDGTYGGMPVRVAIDVGTPPGSSTAPVPFHGTIGHWHVVGTFTPGIGTSDQRSATAHYVLSG